jgi:hypothetical protein
MTPESLSLILLASPAATNGGGRLDRPGGHRPQLRRARPLVTAPELLSEISASGQPSALPSHPARGSWQPGSLGPFNASAYPNTPPWAREPYPGWGAPPSAPWMRGAAGY